MNLIQRLFNRAMIGMSKQGWRRAFDSVNQVCAYLDPYGNSCVVGQLCDHPENCELGDVDIEKSVQEEIARSNNCTVDSWLLEELSAWQQIHDDSEPGEMRDDFLIYADDSGLSWPEEAV